MNNKLARSMVYGIDFETTKPQEFNYKMEI